jgi:hypothetical protein
VDSPYVVLRRLTHAYHSVRWFQWASCSRGALEDEGVQQQPQADQTHRSPVGLSSLCPLLRCCSPTRPFKFEQFQDLPVLALLQDMMQALVSARQSFPNDVTSSLHRHQRPLTDQPQNGKITLTFTRSFSLLALPPGLLLHLLLHRQQHLQRRGKGGSVLRTRGPAAAHDGDVAFGGARGDLRTVALGEGVKKGCGRVP